MLLTYHLDIGSDEHCFDEKEQLKQVGQVLAVLALRVKNTKGNPLPEEFFYLQISLEFSWPYSMVRIVVAAVPLVSAATCAPPGAIVIVAKAFIVCPRMELVIHIVENMIQCCCRRWGHNGTWP